MRHRLSRWFRSLRRQEHGITLIEMSVAVVLLTSVVAVMGPVMTSSLRSGQVMTNESRAIDEIRVAVARIDRELRSACLVTAPALNASGSQLTFKTQIDSAGGPYEVTYEVVDGQLTRTRGTDTEVIGEGLVVTSEEFRYTENAAQARAQIAVDLNVSFEDSNAPRSIGTTIAGRNTWTACI